MRNQLLKFLGVRPFSKQAQFVNPCLSYVLADVICEACNWRRDVDLCRDEHLVGHELDGDLQWACANCSVPYGRDMIEARLVDLVQRASAAYQLQDLVCTKCHAVKPDNLSRYCVCSGNYECEQSRSSFLGTLQPFANVAQYYKLEWLQETIESLSA